MIDCPCNCIQPLSGRALWIFYIVLFGYFFGVNGWLYRNYRKSKRDHKKWMEDFNRRMNG